MTKRILGVAAGLAVLGGAWVLAGSRSHSQPSTTFPVRDVLPDARPLVWLDERILLAGVDNKIVKLDTRDPQNLEFVFEPYYPRQGYECFSRDGGRFAITQPVKIGSSTSYAKMVYHWIQDWDDPGHAQDLDTLESWNTNPHDCSAVEFERASGDERWAEQLLKANDGRTTVYYRGSGLENPHERIVTVEKLGHTKDVWLATTPRFVSSQIDVASDFDDTTGQYLWYLSTDDFDVASNHWPLMAWWVAPEGRVVKIVPLPSGPWIRPFTVLYQLRHFSCGPQCYSHMKMWAGGGQIYIAVWGKAIAGDVEGVYRLDASGQSWEKIIAGELDNGLVLSPSGCQIGYGVGGELRIMRVCEQGAADAAS